MPEKEDIQELSPEELGEKIAFLMKNGSLLGIVLTLQMYKSLSAPEISKVMNIKKTTMFNYLNQLEEMNFVEMDEEKSHEEWLKLGARARKYYRATKLSHDIIDLYGQEGDSYEELYEELKDLPAILSQPDGNEIKMVKLIQGLAQDTLDLGSFIAMASQMNTAIMNITYAELNQLIELARKGVSEDKLKEEIRKSIFSSKTALNIYPFFIDIHTAEQAHEYLTTFRKFQLDITQMKERFEKDNKQNPPDEKAETQYLFMFSAPVRRNA